jgi:hypothetical protein
MMATLTILDPPGISGNDLIYTAAAAGGDSFAHAPTVLLSVKNGGAESVEVTVDAQIACDQGFFHHAIIAIPAGATRLIGPFQARFKQSDGKVNVTYSDVTSVTVAAFKSA